MPRQPAITQRTQALMQQFGAELGEITAEAAELERGMTKK
jgi:hypothetical protein